MRPVSIVWFERFYLTALALGLLSTIINWSTLMAATQATPGASGILASSSFSIAIIAFSFGISLLLWYFIAKRGSKVAKWILTVLVVIGLLGLPTSLRNPMFSTTMIAFALLNALLQLAALVCLFRADARDWFNGAKPTDPNVFS